MFECIICDNEMKFIEYYFTDLLGYVKVFKCPMCNEIMYQPIK